MKALAPALMILAASALAQQPNIINGKVENRAISGPLAAEMAKIQASATSALWAAYTVPAVRGQGSMCGAENHNGIVRLEGPESLVILFRMENREIDRVRVASLDCEFDAGGLPFLFLSGAQPAQSVEFLARMAHAWTQAGRKAHFDSLISAIALHRDPAADRALEAMLAVSEPESLREKALFWMAQARGPSGLDAVKRVLRGDPSDRIREKATFALTVSKEAGAIPALIDSAQNDRAPKVRSQALFWLAHKAGIQEGALIAQAAQKDTDAHVRRQAVFALSQIPNGDGVPAMIQLAKSAADPEVRKQAVFWLGQSRDSRAGTFFQDVLK